MGNNKKTYPPGNVELLTMFKSQNFDKEAAAHLLAAIPNLNEPILNLRGYSSTYLFEAESCNNVEAVRFLLGNGADPNLDVEDLIDECALIDLHFLWEEMLEERSKRLEIAKLFFEFGGDPNLWYEDETLYDHVLWEVFHWDIPHDREYLCSFLKILIAYGGGGGKSSCPKPDLTEPIDKNRIDEYEFKLFRCDDGYHLEGHLFNPDGDDIGIV